VIAAAIGLLPLRFGELLDFAQSDQGPHLRDGDGVQLRQSLGRRQALMDQDRV